MAESLKGRVAFITGASSGIGRAAAVAYAAAGLKVGLAARRETELAEAVAACEAAGGEAVAFPVDVADEAAVRAAVAATAAKWGRLDVLVASAGWNMRQRNYDVVSGEDFRRVMDVNVNGMFYATQAAIAPMKATGGGVMILVSSIASRRQSTFTGPAYTASKHAVNGLGQALAAAHQKDHIRVTVLVPGAVNTPILRRVPVPIPEDALNNDAIQPEDIADICLLLAALPARCTIPVVDIVPTVFGNG